jgi:hypothetical protein
MYVLCFLRVDLINELIFSDFGQVLAIAYMSIFSSLLFLMISLSKVCGLGISIIKLIVAFSCSTLVLFYIGYKYGSTRSLRGYFDIGNDIMAIVKDVRIFEKVDSSIATNTDLCHTHLITTYFYKSRLDWQRNRYVKVEYEYMERFYDSVTKVRVNVKSTKFPRLTNNYFFKLLD